MVLLRNVMLCKSAGNSGGGSGGGWNWGGAGGEESGGAGEKPIQQELLELFRGMWVIFWNAALFLAVADVLHRSLDWCCQVTAAAAAVGGGVSLSCVGTWRGVGGGQGTAG
jgi:hypothetical protein